MAKTSKSVSLKLVIDVKNQRVLYAEADKNAVDFLFHILTLPMATVIKLLKKQQMVGCLGNLYDSVENLSETYIQPNHNKQNLLQPRISVGTAFLNSPLSQDNFAIYADRCLNDHSYYTDWQDVNVPCPSCKKIMAGPMKFTAPSDGFVKEATVFMVMDDLVVKPMATTSSISVLSKFNVKDVETLEERVVNLGINEALNLLKASLASNRVLTTLFI